MNCYGSLRLLLFSNIESKLELLFGVCFILYFINHLYTFTLSNLHLFPHSPFFTFIHFHILPSLPFPTFTHLHILLPPPLSSFTLTQLLHIQYTLHSPFATLTLFHHPLNLHPPHPSPFPHSISFTLPNLHYFLHSPSTFTFTLFTSPSSTFSILSTFIFPTFTHLQ